MRFDKMSKKELVELMKGVDIEGGGVSRGGRKESCLELLKEGVYFISELGEMLDGISNKNVSCLLSYLRNDGYIFNDVKVNGNKKIILVGVVRDGVKVGGRIVKGENGRIVKFDWEKGCFDDEVKKEEEEKEKEK